MATLDEILGGGSTPSGGNPPKGSKKLAEQNSGENAPASSSPTDATQSGANSKPSSGAGAPASGGGGGGYEELFKKLNPYTPPTADELEKEKKRERRAQLFAAIGDGITALSNLYFASQYAPNMYNGQNTLTGANKVRYDKLIKDRDEKNMAYFNGLLRARQADAEAANLERSWQRQLERDQEERDRYNKENEYGKERDRIKDERQNRNEQYKKERDEKTDRRLQENFEEGKRQFDLSHNFQVRQHNDNVAVRREQAKEKAARDASGKQLIFADGNGKHVAIHEDVWEGSMQTIYNALVEDGITPDAIKLTKGMSASDKEDFVKQNWHRSDKARKLMLEFSKYNPATMTSELNDDVEEYTPGGGDDEVIDYTPGKK